MVYLMIDLVKCVIPKSEEYKINGQYAFFTIVNNKILTDIRLDFQ